MSRKVGRPKTENPRNVNLNLRLTKDEAQLIQECADDLNVSRTDVIMQGVQTVKVELDKKK